MTEQTNRPRCGGLACQSVSQALAMASEARQRRWMDAIRALDVHDHGGPYGPSPVPDLLAIQARLANAERECNAGRLRVRELEEENVRLLAWIAERERLLADAAAKLMRMDRKLRELNGQPVRAATTEQSRFPNELGERSAVAAAPEYRFQRGPRVTCGED